MITLGPYDEHLSPPPDEGPYYEPCPDCKGTGRDLDMDHNEDDCESCDGKGEIKIEP